MPDTEVSIRLQAVDNASDKLEKVQQATEGLDGGLRKASSSFDASAVASAALGFSLANLAVSATSAFKSIVIESVNAADHLQLLQNRAEVLFGERFPQASAAIDRMAVSLNRDRS